MKKKARKKRGPKHKGKHDVLAAACQPDLGQGITPSVDLTSSASSSSTAMQESSPRGGDEINKHNTPPPDEQVPSRPLYADVVRRSLPHQALQPPTQCEEIHDNSSEDNVESSPDNSSENHDDYSLDIYSEDCDDFDGAHVPSSEDCDDFDGAHVPSYSSTTRSEPISTAVVNEHNTPPRHPTYLDAASKGKQPAQKEAPEPLMQPNKEMPPPDPRLSYAGVLMADQRPPPPPGSHRAANVPGGASSTYGARDLVPQQVLPPFVETLENLDYYFEDQGSFSLTKLDAAQLIPVGANTAKEITKIRKICEPHVGYLRSIKNLRGLLKHRLVKRVKIFRGKMTILLPTAQGRLFAQAMVAVISECHSQNKSWNGRFDYEHIRIIEPRNSMEFMMILKDPVFEGETLLQAKANDLCKAAVILQSLYKDGDDLPVYFDEFIENLQHPIMELVENEKAFMEYLGHHLAIMPSTGRSTLVSKLSNIGTDEEDMKSKPTAYPYDWRTIVRSEIVGKMKARDINRREKKDTDIISVLHAVFQYNNNYNDKLGGLIRFMRNVLHHGKEHDDRVIHGYELELYLAKMFSGFPSTLRTMLMSGTMKQLFGEDWSFYKISKWNKWEPAWSD